MSLFDNPPLHDFPDRALRQALEDPDNLRDLLRVALPGLVDRFDFGQVQLVRPTFLLEDWRGRESDLLFLIPFRTEAAAEPVLVCVLLEHQSRADARMPLRLLLYAVLFWERQWKEWEDSHAEGEGLRLTPVVPIVFHTAPRPWGTNRTLAEMMAGPEELRAFAPRWPVVFWDLAERTPGELLDADGSFLQLLALVRAEARDAETFRELYVRLMRQLVPLGAHDKIRWADLMWIALS
jgi:hypothetical protein